MSIINLVGLSVTESSYRRARQIVENKPEVEERTAEDVLASLREMMPGWNITTCASQWGPGGRNVEISQSILQRMSEDPDAMVRYKALLLDLDEAAPAIEEWQQQNPGKLLELDLIMDDGGVRAMAIVRTLMGEEVSRSTFELPDDRPTWAELFRQKIDSIEEAGRDNSAPPADESRSWLSYLTQHG